MKKLFLYIAVSTIIFAATACSSGFNQSKAEDLLQKTTLTSEEYDSMIELYGTAVDDAIKLSKKPSEDLNEKERDEIITLFALGMRLSKDDAQLSDSQRQQVAEINNRGTAELSK